MKQITKVKCQWTIGANRYKINLSNEGGTQNEADNQSKKSSLRYG